MTKYICIRFALVFFLASFAAVAQGQQSQTGTAAIGGLIDVVVSNTSLLNELLSNNTALNNLLAVNGVQVINLNDLLSGNQSQLLTGLLQNSSVLSNNSLTVRNLLNNNTLLQNFLQNINISFDRVVALDVLSAPVTIYVFGR